MRFDHRPRVLVAPEQPEKRHAEHMRNDRLRGGGAVARYRGDVAADRVQESVNLAQCMVKSAGACPPVGATEDRVVPVFAPNTFEFGGGDVQRLVPRKFNERVLSAPLTRPVPVSLEPTLADRWTQDAGAVVDGGGKNVGDGGGFGSSEKGAAATIRPSSVATSMAPQ